MTSTSLSFGAARRPRARVSVTVSGGRPPIRPPSRTLVVGLSDNECSLTATKAAAQLAGASDQLVLVTAVSVSTPKPYKEWCNSGRDIDLCNALKDEAYILEPAYRISELQRVAREVARRVGAERVETEVIPGSPLNALSEVVYAYGANALFFGARAARPTRLARAA